MNLKLNGNGNGTPRPYLKIGLLAVAVVALGVLVFRQVDRLVGPKRDVWVVKSELDKGETLTAEHLEQRRLRESRIPEDVVEDLGAVLGRRLARRKATGEPVAAVDLVVSEPGSSSIAGLVPAGRVLMTLRAGARSLPLNELRRGDRLDVLAVNSRAESGSVASDVYFVGWLRGNQADGKREKASIFGIDLAPPGRPAGDETVSLLLAVRPEDVFRLARAEAAPFRLSIVLHGTSEVQGGELLELEAPRRSEIELIAGARRQSLPVKP